MSHLYELILARRTIRRFKQRKINTKILKKIINAGRLAPSAANLQPIEYILIKDEKIKRKIFENIKLGGYFKDWIPKESERPMYYVVLITNKKIAKNPEFDCGCASENICLASTSFGIGSCIIKNANKKEIAKILKIPKKYEINCLIALGYPAEKSKVVKMKDSVKYFRKGNFVFVPKRNLRDILHINKY
ncbi:MAG: nitroreductase family protein [Candidatus Micrarchaeia archaeon]